MKPYLKEKGGAMNYETTYQTTTTGMSSAEAATLSGMLLFFGIFALAIYLLTAVAMWRLFTKAGEAGWKSLIPVYNSWVFLRMGDQASWWAIVGLVPVVGIVGYVFMAIAAYNIGLKLQKEAWWVILYIIVPIIWLYILAFDKSTWKATAAGTIDSPVSTGSDTAKPAYVPAEKTADTNSTEEPATKPPVQL